MVFSRGYYISQIVIYLNIVFFFYFEMNFLEFGNKIIIIGNFNMVSIKIDILIVVLVVYF